MPTEQTYGLEVPDAGDLASQWMQSIEDNFVQIDAHTHDGLTSAPLPIGSLTKLTSVIAATGYTDLGGGNYSKLITVPALITEINSYLVQFRITATGERIYPSMVRASATTYTIYLNSQLAITAVYV